jgi:pimeloyl-ACP methyl ester carboxylesterase
MKTIFALILFCAPLLSIGQQNAYVSPAGTKFLLYTPPAYATSTDEFPLLISLHGKGEWGSDITKLTSGNSTGMPSRLIYLNQWPAGYNFIVLTPQYNPPNLNDMHPVWPPSHIDEVLNYVLANWRVKDYRVYVTGLSLGANATWNYAAAYPHKVAAIVPICGRADLTKACFLKDIPAWVFHADNDPTAHPAFSVDMVNTIDDCQPAGTHNRKFNYIYTKAHEGWNEIYNGSSGYRIFEWLMKFTKLSSANVTPYVNAGPDINVKAQPTLNIVGDAFDSKGVLTTVRWTQVAGPVLPLADTDKTTLQVSNIQAGGTYEFQLSATDNSGATVTDRVIIRGIGTTSLPVINRLVLVNGLSNTDVRDLVQGITIDKNLSGLSQINIRAEATSNTQSVRFTINSNRNARTVNAPGPFLIKTPDAVKPEWEVNPEQYVICATPYSSANAGGTRGVSVCYKVKIIEGIPMAGCEGAGTIFREVWPGVTGQYVNQIPLATAPAVEGQLYRFEAPTGEVGVGDNYGARIRGYICPPQTGNYSFWIASDDRSELWLSTDDNPSNKRLIAAVNGYTASRQWTKYASQKSAVITLTAATKYYIEALHKEALQSDNLAVGWQLPNGTLERPIPAMRIIPFNAVSASFEPEMESVSTEKGFNIYPNPVNRSATTLSLEKKDFGSLDATVVVTSLTGETVLSSRISCEESCEQVEINFDRPLRSGVYIIHLITASETISKKLLVH